jgi:glycosyltransferase involved in cell wall biosynthesis
MKIALCLVVRNEINGCRMVVPHLPQNEFNEIYAVDGGSTDGTVEYLEEQGIKVYGQEKSGLNNAYILANDISQSQAVVVFFPKGTLLTSDLYKFRPFLESGLELVVASRQIRGSVNEEDSHWWRPRKWAVWVLGVLAAVLWRRRGPWVRDVLHGVKGWQKQAFYKMDILPYGLSIDLEMVVRSYKLNLSRIEFPVVESARPYGETAFKAWPTGKLLLKYILYELRRTK